MRLIGLRTPCLFPALSWADGTIKPQLCGFDRLSSYLLGATHFKTVLITEFVKVFVTRKKAFQLLDIHRNNRIDKLSYKSFRERELSPGQLRREGLRGITGWRLLAMKISSITNNWYVERVFYSSRLQKALDTAKLK